MDTREAGRRGGKARARRMKPEQRARIARKAARARWRKVNKEQRLTSKRVDSDVAEYLALLDSRVTENRVQEFLASHSYFFHGLLLDVCYPYPLYSKVRLGSEYETDFASFISSSFGCEWRFAEIESPKQRLFTKGGNPSAQLTHAIQQVRDWIRWCEENLNSARRLMPGLQYPMAFVFLGRRSELTATITEKLRQMNHQQNMVRIRTLDSLAGGARSVKAFTRAGSWELRISMKALSHVDLARGVSPKAQEALTFWIPEEFARWRRDQRIWDFDE
jgi:hypothetical protein